MPTAQVLPEAAVACAAIALGVTDATTTLAASRVQTALQAPKLYVALDAIVAYERRGPLTAATPLQLRPG